MSVICVQRIIPSYATGIYVLHRKNVPLVNEKLVCSLSERSSRRKLPSYDPSVYMAALLQIVKIHWLRVRQVRWITTVRCIWNKATASHRSGKRRCKRTVPGRVGSVKKVRINKNSPQICTYTYTKRWVKIQAQKIICERFGIWGEEPQRSV